MPSDRTMGNNGAFTFRLGGLRVLAIVSDSGRWDHVSASSEKRCLTWDEMCQVKNMFFEAEEWVFQFHPPRTENINFHEHCLHLWRPQDQEFPTPPPWMVGPPNPQTQNPNPK